MSSQELIRIEAIEHPIGGIHARSNEMLVHTAGNISLMAVIDVNDRGTISQSHNAHFRIDDVLQDVKLEEPQQPIGPFPNSPTLEDRLEAVRSYQFALWGRSTRSGDFLENQKRDKAIGFRFSGESTHSVTIFDADTPLLHTLYRNADYYDDWEDYHEGGTPTEADMYLRADLHYMLGAKGELTDESTEAAVAATFAVIEGQQKHCKGALTQYFGEHVSSKQFETYYTFGTVTHDRLKTALGLLATSDLLKA